MSDGDLLLTKCCEEVAEAIDGLTNSNTSLLARADLRAQLAEGIEKLMTFLLSPVESDIYFKVLYEETMLVEDDMRMEVKGTVIKAPSIEAAKEMFAEQFPSDLSVKREIFDIQIGETENDGT